jgi:hypothetical protein
MAVRVLASLRFGMRLTHCLCCRWQLGKCKQRAHPATENVPASTLQQYDIRIEQLEDAMLKARVVGTASLRLTAGSLCKCQYAFRHFDN